MTVLLTDIGDVLFKLRPEAYALICWQQHLNSGKLDRKVVHGFMLGQISEDEYIDHVSASLQLPHYIVHEVESRFIGDMNMRLVDFYRSKVKVPIYAFSNTTAMHWRIIDGRLPNRLFKKHFLSYELGMCKPDPAIFEYVKRELDVTTDDIVYVDDRIDNIASAKCLGIKRCVHHSDQDKTIDELSRHLRLQMSPKSNESRKFFPSHWPEVLPPKLAEMACDRRVIAHYDTSSLQSIEAWQLRRVSSLLSHACAQSKWWSDRLEHALGNEKYGFDQLPAMSRVDFRKSLADAGGSLLTPTNHGNRFEIATSGSSGIPVSFYCTDLAARMNNAHYEHDRIVRQKISFQNTMACITSRVDEIDRDCVVLDSQSLFDRPKKFVRGIKSFTVEQHALWLASLEVDCIVANAGLLDAILDLYNEGAVTRLPTRGQIKFLLTYSETVSHEMRSKAMSILGAKVIDRYSCEEVGPLAFQCPTSDEHYHIAATNCIVEVLDEKGSRSSSGEIGRVHVTTLHNFACPVVRYELGDLAAWLPRCVCGYNKPVLTKLLGRTRFLIRLPSGERMHVRIKARDWLNIAPFSETRIVQRDENSIEVECVIDRELTRQEVSEIKKLLEVKISPLISYSVRQVASIAWGPSYKRQDVVSLI